VSTQLRLILLGPTALISAVLAVGFGLQLAWAAALLPWDAGRLTLVFLASILASIAAGALWIMVSGEAAAIPAGALNLAVMMGGLAILMFTAVQPPAAPDLRLYGAGAAVLAVANLAVFGWLVRSPIPDNDTLPRLVRASFVVFTGVLVAVGGALILGTPGVMPWPLDRELSVLIGVIFFSDAFYFLYAVLRPVWPAARAQLWSFLVYDAVLIVPLAGHLGTVPPELRTNLLVYLAILGYSGLLAVYYLFVDHRSAIWARQRQSRVDGIESARLP
jgi:hypothetical protein